jgi:hypothetical protein
MHYDGLNLVIQGNHVTVYDDDGYRFDAVGSDGAFRGKNAVQRAKDAIDREAARHTYKHHPGLGVKVKRNGSDPKLDFPSFSDPDRRAATENLYKKMQDFERTHGMSKEVSKVLDLLVSLSAALARAEESLYRRNGKKPTYKAARLATWKAFGAAGWDLSSPHLNVLHATSPWGDVRLWFKAQAILVGHGGSPWRMGDARTLAYDLDLRTVTDYPAFVRAVGKRLGFK